MQIRENVPLAQYTTFKIGGPARFFCAVSDDDESAEAVRFAKEKGAPIFTLGGGSNLLISDSGFDGLVIKMEMKGITMKSEVENRKSVDLKSFIISAAAGEQWDDLVEWAVARDLSGLENLSAIPGTVGAAPIQNIGAYGTDVSSSIVSVRAYDAEKMSFVEFSNKDCGFSYRDSMFKRRKGRYIVTRVDFRLSKGAKPNIGYKDVKGYFSVRDIQNPTIAQVREAIIDIRWNKLPDWKLWGTAGSFFKNPIISKAKYAVLKKKYPDMPAYLESPLKVKIPLGWVLEKLCDAKLLSSGRARVYEKQALVLVTQPGAKSEEVIALSHELMKRVKEKTGIDIECEVEWVN